MKTLVAIYPNSKHSLFNSQITFFFYVGTETTETPQKFYSLDKIVTEVRFLVGGGGGGVQLV